MWQIVATKAEKVRVVKAEGKKNKGGSRKEVRRKERKKDRSMKDSKGVGDLG